MIKVEAEHGIFARVTIPFDGPELYVRPGFGAAVTKGDSFTVLLCTGSILDNPSE